MLDRNHVPASETCDHQQTLRVRHLSPLRLALSAGGEGGRRPGEVDPRLHFCPLRRGTKGEVDPIFPFPMWERARDFLRLEPAEGFEPPGRREKDLLSAKAGKADGVGTTEPICPRQRPVE